MKALLLFPALLIPFVGCGDSSESLYDDDTGKPQANAHDHDGDGIPDHAPGEHSEDEHEHDDEVDLGKTMVGKFEVSLAQGHGMLAPGSESHLVVKLPYSDQGATIVRAWIGSEDRSLSRVGKGEYAKSHDDYDVHADAPDPLPFEAKWWIEIEEPDGSKSIGSITPLR